MGCVAGTAHLFFLRTTVEEAVGRQETCWPHIILFFFLGSRYGVEHGPQHVFNFSSQGCVSDPNRSYSGDLSWGKGREECGNGAED